jgi:hypothetical protein
MLEELQDKAVKFNRYGDKRDEATMKVVESDFGI